MAPIEFLEGNVSREFAGIKTISKTLEAFDLEALDEDPQIIFKPEDALRPGWYRIDLDMDVAQDVRPQVFFDFGGGFSEVFSTLLKRQAGSRFSAMLKLPYPALIVRLDPTNIACAFKLNSFRIRPLSAPALAIMLGRQGLRTMGRDPRGFVGRLPSYLNALRQPYFLQLRDNVHTGGSASYAAWIKHHDFNAERDTKEIAAAVAALKQKPLISVVMPVYNTPADLLEEAIASVAGQIYPNWELCIADDHSTEPHVRRILEDWQRRDSRIKVVFREENGHISISSNSAAELASGEWIALLDHDDLLPANALAETAFAIARNPDARMIYSDEDKIDTKGSRKEPYFKTDWNYHLFLSQNMFSHFGVYEANLFRAAGGFRKGFEGAQDYDLALRCSEKVNPSQIVHIPKILYHWRQLPGSTSVNADEKPYAMIAGERALNEHYQRIGVDAEAELIGFGYRARRKLPAAPPRVTIIIPTRDKVNLLAQCLDSLLTKTTYPNYDVLIIDNGSEESETFQYYDSLKSSQNVRIKPYKKPFNFSAMCNFGVASTKSEYVLLLNNDTQVIGGDWLSEMVSIARDSSVGAVGARLWFPDDRLQHAGLVLSPVHIAMNAHRLMPRGHHGYFGRATLTHQCSAVTAACLLVARSKYSEVGGMNEADLPVAYNDVDFCLKLLDAGYRNVCATFAELYHYESASRGVDDMLDERYRSEKEYMLVKWRERLAHDRCYSPNLTIDNDNFDIAV